MDLVRSESCGPTENPLLFPHKASSTAAFLFILVNVGMKAADSKKVFLSSAQVKTLSSRRLAHYARGETRALRRCESECGATCIRQVALY